LILRIMAGRASPAGLADAGVQQLRLLGTDVNAVDHCQWVDAPVPWDPTLATQYTELMRALGAWLDEPDGAGGRKGDHVFLIPVSMPSYLGTEMVIGYGQNATCPPGTDGEGQNLRSTNLAIWNTVSTVDERRSWTEQAWRAAIAIHMAELPTANDSVIAYGHVFEDAHAAALRIATDEVARYPGRLWSMYTNLQPSTLPGGGFGPWRDACPQCHATILAALAAGGSVGFQTAARIDAWGEYHAAVEDGLATYPMAFLETNPDRLDEYAGYLLTDAPAVQDRLTDVAHRRATTTEVSCAPAVVGEPTTCTALVREVHGAPPGEPGGVDAVTWSSDGAGSFSATACTPAGGDGTASCSVGYVPASADAQEVTASYGGDGSHLVSAGSATLAVSRRSSSTSVACTPAALIAGATTVCTATVRDAVGTAEVTPGGSVTWSSSSTGAFSSASCALDGAGATASCSVSYLAAATGEHLVGAVYQGDPFHDGSDTADAPAAVVVSPDRPPTVSITFPTDGASVAKGKTTVVTATASDDVAVVSVAFTVNSGLRCTDTSAPYSCSWPVPKKAGVRYTLTATATDGAGHTASHSVTVTAR
jgi:hypothetical protein